VQETCSRHEPIADRLDLLKTVLRSNPLEDDEQRIEPRYHLFGLMLVAIGGEVGHVAEQHRDILIAPRDDRADAADFVRCLLRQQGMQQLIGFGLRLLGFAQRILQGQLCSYPGENHRCGKRLVDVVYCTDLKAQLLVAFFGLRRQKDHGDVRRFRILFQPAADLIPIHARHHHIKQYEIRPLRACGNGKRLLTVGRDLGAILIFQDTRYHRDIGRSVVDDQNESFFAVYHYSVTAA
jgi:hypothetical protein